jgi:flagellar biosynthetic protein FlhB
LLRLVAAPFALVWTTTVLSSLAQGGLVVSTEPIQPSWHRLNPFTNLQQAFSMSALSRTLKSLVPVVVILYVSYGMARRDWIAMATSSHGGVGALLAWIAGRLYEVAWNCSLILLAWSVVDYAFQRYQLSQTLKMTKQEVIQESKDTEGNPFTRNRIRKRQREVRKRWSMKDVERATAIVANPQHLAIALEYRPQTMAAPVVLAKGMNEVALRIKDAGRWNNIPIVENPPLAQALYRATEVGETIPAKLYAAVAEILAFIYRTQASLRNSARSAPNGQGITQGRS